MFVPLPVPFVFQRTAPDLTAWRLKSPLALRSNSGKTSFLFSTTPPPPAAPPPPPPPTTSSSSVHTAVQTRPALLGADALAAAVGAHTHFHSAPAPFAGGSRTKSDIYTYFDVRNPVQSVQVGRKTTA